MIANLIENDPFFTFTDPTRIADCRLVCRASARHRGKVNWVEVTVDKVGHSLLFGSIPVHLE